MISGALLSLNELCLWCGGPWDQGEVTWGIPFLNYLFAFLLYRQHKSRQIRRDHQQVLDWSKGFILTFWGPEGLLINFQPVYRYISWLILHQPWHLVTTPLVLSWFMPSWDHSCPVNFISCLVFIQIRFFVPIQKTNRFDMDRNWVWIVWVWAQIDWVQNGVGYKMIRYLAFRWKFHMT